MRDQKHTEDTYDYVVVGAGSAGAVMANRLSEEASVSVCVLEAGGHDRHLAVRVPAGLPKIKSDWDWNYPAEPDPSRNGFADTWPGGKLVGGSSSINAMVWVRGNRMDFNTWAALGAEGWDYESVLPYFKRAENFEGGADAYRGVGGPQQVSYMRIDNPTIPAYVQGATEAGLPRNEDYNGATQLGAAIGQTSQKNGLRESTARSYLAPALRRENLTLRTHAQVSRILFEGDRAVGVEYVSKGRTHRVRAEREVVVCGGAIASPKILMVSGIGPEAELRRHGVEVIADLPGVGQNLMEHPHAFMKFQVNVSTLNTELKPLPAMKHGLDFLLRRRGALTSNFNQGILFAESPTAKWVDLEMQMYAFGVNAVTAEEADEYGLSHEIHQVQLDKDPMITMLPAFLRPSHRGSIGLRSSDPAAKPVIRYELVGHPDDMEGMLAGVKLAREIARTPSMRKLITAEVTPGPDVRTDDDIRGYLRVAGFTGKHPSGTCRIGTDDDAVVDPELKVRGVRGLRVVDASVMPQVTSGNTNSPTIMIAERAADLIKADRLQSLIACRPASAQVALAR